MVHIIVSYAVIARSDAFLLLPPFEWLAAPKTSTSIPSVLTTSLSMRKCLRQRLSSGTAKSGEERGSQLWKRRRTCERGQQKLPCEQERTHDRRNSSHNDLIQPHFLVLLREPPQQLIKVVRKQIGRAHV